MSFHPLTALNKWASKIGKTNLLLLALFCLLMWWISQ
jgi:hypothetical protein